MGLEATYDSHKKQYITFRFNMKLMDLFTMDFHVDNSKNQQYSFGFDKTFDLKNPTAKIDSMNVSRINILTYVDTNNNNQFDPYELGVGGVDVEVGQYKVTTDVHGKAMIYGVSNNIKQDVKVEIKRPHFILENENIKVYSSSATTVDMYIPIKPMIDLSGYVAFAEELNLTPEEQVDFYNDVLVEIKDKKGKTLEYVAPDNTGHFDVSGLFPEEYIIEVSYLGDKFKIPKLEGALKLSYEEENDNFNYKVVFKITKDKIEMLARQ